ncbi:GNAT family N-acetyltransferase [Arhodomonas sp. SL1]|uniref:GNAT family N-acetyltransferase n=1 Tax=Arhodomonas sp. SL1 TaxID=3425691 RepID=UPI003F88319F
MSDESRPGGGSVVVVRRLLWQERDAFAEHLQRLPEHDRYLRFGGHVNEALLESYARQGGWPRRTVFGVFVGDDLRAAGECQILSGEQAREAELAFSVEPSLQGRGIGTALFARLITFARNRGLRRVYLTTMRHNRPMRSIARKFGMELRGGDDELEGRLELVSPDPASLWDEALQEGEAWLWTTWREVVLAGIRLP